jgi:predicted DNA-binding protein
MPVGNTRRMKRTCVFLTPQQLAKLARLSKSTGLKAAELIRRFIDAGLAEQEKK